MLRVSAIQRAIRLKEALGLDPVAGSCERHQRTRAASNRAIDAALKPSRRRKRKAKP